MKRLIITGSFILVATLLPFAGASAGETLYRWLDEGGNPVNSDRPPPKGVEYEVISTDSSMVRKVESGDGAVPLKVKPSVSNDFDAVDTKKPAIVKNPEYCSRAQDNLVQLDTRARIRLRNDQGELRYIDEEEKETQRQQAKAMMAIHCE